MMAKVKNKVVFYDHHGTRVAVRSCLKGKHREHCLCHICKRFFPEDRDLNCAVANLVYALDVAQGLTTPVWECPRFQKE